MADQRKIVVIDLGTGTVKVGIAGDLSPKYVYPAVQTDSTNKAISNGLICDWKEAETLLRSAFSKLQVNPEEYTVLLGQSILNTAENKEKMAKMLFEKFRTPAIFFAYNNVASLYSVGKLNGLVLESGAGHTSCVAIYQGFAIMDSIVKSDVTGDQVTSYLMKSLNNPNVDSVTANDVKERMCTLTTPSSDTSFQLPDGNTISLNQDAQMAAEVLFKPSLAKMETRSIVQAILDCIGQVREKHGEERARMMQENIVLSGGNTLFNGLADRVKSELEKELPGAGNVNVSTCSKYSSWIGCSVLACHEQFKPLCVTKEQYAAEGKAAVHKMV